MKKQLINLKASNGGGGGSTVTVDSQLSSTSENPVQNKVVTAALNGKQATLTAGQNITIENNVISATSGGGTKKYLHRIYNQVTLANYQSGSYLFSFDVITTNSTPFADAKEVYKYLKDLPTKTLKIGGQYTRGVLLPITSTMAMTATMGSTFTENSEFQPAFLTFYNSDEWDQRFYISGLKSVVSGSNILTENIAYNFLSYNGTKDTIVIPTSITLSVIDEVIEL